MQATVVTLDASHIPCDDKRTVVLRLIQYGVHFTCYSIQLTGCDIISEPQIPFFFLQKEIVYITQY